MVFSAKSNNNNNNNEGWGMGFLLVFFDHHPHPDEEYPTNYTRNKKTTAFSLSGAGNVTGAGAKSAGVLLSKTQSTLSICGLLLFTTLLLFTLSTFEPTSTNNNPSRRLLQQNYKSTPSPFSIATLFGPKSEGNGGNFIGIASALQGMGALYLKGTKAMTDLIVGHVSEEASEKEVRSFLRLIQHSGLLSKSDLVLLFPTPLLASRFGPVVKAECDSFFRLVHLYRELSLSYPGRDSVTGLTRYLRVVGEGEKEAIWGKRNRVGSNLTTELAPVSHCSVVGFEASELDPEDSLSGFLDRVPMSLRRWASYPMLLGRVRRNFKHVMLVDVKNSLVLGDPFSRVRNRSSESVLLWPNSETESTRSVKRNSAKTHNHDQKNQLNPGVIIGGSRGVRRFSTTALTEIVRVIIEHKGKSRNSVTESGVVNQLVHNGHLLKNINLIRPNESIPDAGSLAGFNSVDSGSSFLLLSDYYTVAQRGHGGVSGNFDIDYVVMREICSSHQLYSSLYSDCLVSH